MKNPYIAGRKVSGPDRFFGREVLLEKLRANFLASRSPACVSIVGETRIGKSSLVEEFLRRHAGELAPTYRTVQLNLAADFHSGHTLAFYAQLIRLIWDELCCTAPELSGALDGQVAPLLEQAQSAPESQRAFFRLLSQTNAPLLLVLDEFDHATELFGFDSQGFHLLRHLASDLHPCHVLLTISRRTVLQIELAQKICSNLAGLFHGSTCWVGRLSPAEARALVVEPAAAEGAAWPEPAVAEILRLGGGHPFLTQLVCRELFPRLRPGAAPPIPDDVAPAAREALLGLLDLVRPRLEGQQLWEPLVAIARGEPIDLLPRQLERLVHLGYLDRPQPVAEALFSPLLAAVLADRALPAWTAEPEPPANWIERTGWDLGPHNVLLEGETDAAYLTRACELHQAAGGADLTGGGSLRFIPVGLGRAGGAKKLARAIVAIRETRQAECVALLDNDPVGQAVAGALDRLELQRKRDFLLIDRKLAFDAAVWGSAAEVEIEHLISPALQARLAEQTPDGVTVTRKGEHLRFDWDGQSKGALVHHVRREAVLADLQPLVELVRLLRVALGLPAEPESGDE